MLKKQLNSEVHFLTKQVNSDLVINNPYIDTVIIFRESISEIIDKLKAVDADFLNPIETNKILKKLDSFSQKKPFKESKINWFTPIHIFTRINSFFPLLLWKKLKPKIKDIIFTNTYRFALILTIFPLFYLIQAGIISFFFNYKVGLIYLGICIITSTITSKTMIVTP